MAPTVLKKNTLAAWVAGVTLAAILISTGNAYGRFVDWSSAELFYTGSTQEGYSSDCLIPGGQRIILSDWTADQSSKTVTFSVSKPVIKETVPEEITPEETTPEETTPEETTPEETTPEETTPEETTPEETTPEETTPEETTPEETTPEETTPEETTPEETTPEETTPEETTPEETTPEETTPEETTPEETTPEETTPEETTPEETTPEETIPDETTSDDPVTEEAGPQPEVIVTMDDVASKHLTCNILNTDSTILLTFSRIDGAPGLLQSTPVTIHVAWYGLEGTLCFSLLPYGDVTEPEAEEETSTGTESDSGAESTTETEPEQGTEGAEETQREIVTGLNPVVITDVIDPYQPVVYVKLNLETQTDFSLSFTSGNQKLNRIRFSTDGGATYSLLYESNQLDFAWPYMDGWDGFLILDFSNALQQNQSPTIFMKATGYSSQEFKPAMQAQPVISSMVVKAAHLPYTLDTETSWGAAKLQILQIQRLIRDEQGVLHYTEDGSMTATVTQSGILLQPTVSDLLPASGSYSMTVQWIWNEIILKEYTIYFFINTN